MNKDRERARGLDSAALGFSLIETVIAIAVIAVTFIGLIGLLGLGVANDQTSTEQTAATNIASSILADLRSTPASSSKSGRFGITLPTSIPGTSAAPFSGASPNYYIYFDNSSNWLPLGGPALYTSPQSPIPSGAAYVANVYLAQLGTVGPTVSQCNDLTRVVVSWPAQTTAIPAGNVDVISQFVLH